MTTRMTEAEADAMRKQWAEEDAKDKIREQNREVLKRRRAEREAQANEKESKEAVPRKTKKEQKKTAKGGTVTKSTYIYRTEFIPNPDRDPKTYSPDYYRTGFLKNVLRKVGDETVSSRVWAPISRRVGERKDALLASIRIVDPRKIGKKTLN